MDDFGEDTNDEQVMSKIRQIVDTIDPSIKSTYDIGNNYEDKRIPLIDAKTWIGRELDNSWKLPHTHHIKDVL